MTKAEEPGATSTVRCESAQLPDAESEAADAQSGPLDGCACVRLACLLLDKSIALLQRLRRRAAETTDSPEADAADAVQGAAATQAAPDDTAVDADGAAPPARRTLYYLGSMLTGVMLGAPLTYAFVAHRFEQRAAELQRNEHALAQHSRSLAAAERKLEQQQAQYAAAQARLAQAQKRLGELRAQQGGGAADSDRARSASCTLVGGDIAATLKGCIEAINRD